jgi:hypothetical protein
MAAQLTERLLTVVAKDVHELIAQVDGLEPGFVAFAQAWQGLHFSYLHSATAEGLTHHKVGHETSYNTFRWTMIRLIWCRC